jgi:transmembrane sensor
MTAQDRSWLLIARAISGEISSSEQEELDALLLADPELRAVFDDLVGMRFTQTADLSSAAKKAMERGLDKLDQSLSNEKRFLERYLFDHTTLRPIKRYNYKAWASVTAIAAMLLISFYIFRPAPVIKGTDRQVISTHYGKRMYSLLPDGSSVWLNAGSSVSYAPDLLKGGKREVTLTGEAYFDVKHDAAHPFIVHAGKLQIVVLGTSFNVKAYKEDAFIETTLIRGKVAITNDARPGKPIILLPDQKVSINTAIAAVKKTTLALKIRMADSLAVSPEAALPDEAITETGWVNDKLTFKKENFSELAAQLERWYDVKITFDNDHYLNKRFTGTFTGQDIIEVMNALQYTQPFHYAINNNEIHIW